ncbi:MAG: glycogen/starch synthase [Saprospiraceae bacterium]|nr:glycogen/starch synthase [Saprospiraceae bacterium]
MRVLFVTQEMDPYTLVTEISEVFKKMPQYVSDKSHEIRVLMPKYGTINERRHRLHEVVRLSGMNIIVNDEDYPLIIKVASIPGARLQVYFLDNDEFFKRKNLFANDDNTAFEDNAERMVFFCKGAMETVKKFGWPPEIVHCHGAFTALIPMYIKKVYHNDPIFKHSKVIYSSYTDVVSSTLNNEFGKIAAINDVTTADLEPYFNDGKIDLNKGAIQYADGVIAGKAELEETVKHDAGNKPFLGFVKEGDHLPAVEGFYHQFLEAE